MKKILLIFLLCNSFCKCEDTIGMPPPYHVILAIVLDDIKDSSVKSIKVTLKNLDGIKPEYMVFEYDTRENLEKKAGIYIVTEQKRDKYIYDGETYYFKGVTCWFRPPWYGHEKEDLALGKKRIYELKTYINDRLFFTKKISFITKENEEGYLYADKIEVDNMDYVKEISKAFRNSEWVIELTDTDIKDKL